MSLLLLHSTGAKSGEERVHPVVYNDLDGRYAIFASLAGAPNNPAWYHNLVAHPEVSIEGGTETVNVTARVTEGEERSSIWEPWKTAVPMFAEYDQKTNREIPVIVLDPRS
jgi:deazaflavin-dependent oxidoreductase (nitroreductase family)